MLDIRVDAENRTAEVRSGGKAINLCVESVIMVKLIIREIASRDERLARITLDTIKDDIRKQTVEEMVEEINASMTKAGENSGRLS